MNKQFPYYPQTKIYDTSFHIQIGTILRKQHTEVYEGGLHPVVKWYNTVHWMKIQKFEFKPLSDIEIAKFINDFHKQVYDFLILGIIDPKLKHLETDKFVYEVCESQISEEERLREMYEL